MVAARGEKGSMSVNEKVLREIQEAYISSEDRSEPGHIIPSIQSLVKTLEKEKATAKSRSHVSEIDADLGKLKKVLPPPERITIMIMGNHSAGKSSFVNWYIDEHVQETSEAIETTGVTIVRRGKKRTSYKGDLTFQECPHLSNVYDIPGLKENIKMEVCCSNEKQFPLIDFIDTPGLTDGTLTYPFDVDKVIEGLAEHAHMIMVFLDPHGQALVNRTMTVVRSLSKNHQEKMRYVLNRSDQVKDEYERSVVMTQCMQELTKNLNVEHGFKLRPVYLPKYKNPTSGPNKIEELCQDIQKETESRIQDALVKMKADLDLISSASDGVLKRDLERSTAGRSTLVWKFLCLLMLIATGAGFQRGFDAVPEQLSMEALLGMTAGALIFIVVVYFSKTGKPPPAMKTVERKAVQGLVGHAQEWMELQHQNSVLYRKQAM